jgi:hypothetical protein
MRKLFCAFFSLFVFISTIFSQEMIKSTFETDSEEWSVNGGNIYYQNQDGNPDGFIEFEDNQDGAGVFVAPDKFLGDLNNYNQGTISFDLKNTINNGQEMLNGFGKVAIVSSDLYAEKNVVPLEYIDNWTTFSLQLTAEEWGLTTTAWDSLISEVTEIRIQVDAQWNYYDRAGLDNFTITPFNNNIEESAFLLCPNFPNPFSTSTTIEYELKSPGCIEITFYNHLGEVVDKIEQYQTQGLNKIVWNAEGFPAGIYNFRLQEGDQVASGKLVIVR